jgi:hypothetical protein
MHDRGYAPLFVFLLLLACASSGGDTGADISETFTCPTASATWLATSGTCPELGESLQVAVGDCDISLTSVASAGPTFTGAFTSATAFEGAWASGATSCTGVWAGTSLDLACRAGAQVCVLTLEPPCRDLSGEWKVTSGMCFPLEARVPLTQGISCDVHFGGLEAGTGGFAATLADGTLAFTHPEHGACQAATDGTVLTGECADHCTFELRKAR